jgi:predicted Zn-dependent peptidase
MLSQVWKTKSSSSRLAVNRLMSTLIATEEFPISVPLTPKAKPASVVKESTLANGVKVITRENGSGTVNVKFTVLSGSSAESTSEKGAAQLLAVSSLAGTGNKSGLRLVRDLENLGAKVNAYATREKITVEVSALSCKAEAAIAAVAEALTKPPSRSYVIEEMKPTAHTSYPSTPQSQLLELIHEAAYGENTPLGSSFFSSNLDSLDVKDVYSFRKSVFTAGNVVVSASGIPHEALVQAIECYLHALPAGKPATPSSPYVGGDIKVKADLDGETHVALAFPFPAGNEGTPYKVLYELLSKDLEGDKAVSPFLVEYAQGGLLGFAFSGAAASTGGSIEAGVSALKRLKTPSSVDAAKAKLSLAAALALEGEATTTALLAPAAAYSSVTASAVGSAATALLSSTPTYAVYGATYGVPPYSAVVKSLK